MPKSFLSDDPFAAAALDVLDHHDARSRRPNPILPFLLIPVLGMALMAVGMRIRPGGPAPIEAVAPDMPEKSVSGERQECQLASIEVARRNVIRWRRANCCGAATPRGRAKMRAWERNYRGRLELYARMYPGQACPRQREP